MQQGGDEFRFGSGTVQCDHGGFPGVPLRAVAADKLLALKAGMHRQEVLGMLGPPLSVSAIQGLDEPRETWTYQVAFGKQVTVRLDSGVVSVPPR